MALIYIILTLAYLCTCAKSSALNAAVATCDLPSEEDESEYECDASLADMSLLQVGFLSAALSKEPLKASLENPRARARSSHEVHEVQELDDTKFGIIVWSGFLIAAVAYDFWLLKGGAEAQKPRDERWDSVKFWCMFMVVWCHMNIFMRNVKYPNGWVSHFDMPGFSFASGLFASGAVTLEGDKTSTSVSKLQGPFRDLVLVQLTILPVSVLSSLTYVENIGQALQVRWSAVANPPLIPIPGDSQAGVYWYLIALFVWHLLLPVICMMSHPVLMAFVVAICCRLEPLARLNQMFFYFPYFVAGFVLGGGGKSGEERSAARKCFEEYLVASETRVAACCLVAICLMSNFTETPPPFKTIFVMSHEVTPWHLGGMCADAARIMLGLPVVLAFIVIVFMMPNCELISSTGSRTLYVYVLHGHLFISNPSLCKLVMAVPDQWWPLANFAMAFLFTLLLGSRLMKKLMHIFVQPQWLVELCTIQPSPAAGGRAAGRAAGG